MEYLDLELRLDAGSEGLYSLSVESPVGEASDRLRISLAEPAFKEDLENARTAATAPRSLVPRKAGTTPAKAVRKLGQELFDALLHDRETYACYRCCLQRARDEGKGLRLRLRINAPELASLPWEYLYDPRPDEHRHLCLSTETPVVRHLELQRPVEDLIVKPPIRILGMIGSHRGLDVEREQSRMQEALAHLIEKDALFLEWLDENTWRDLDEAMRRGPWHVFHFIGHGGFDPDTGEGLLLLEGEGEGEGAGGEPPTHRLMARELAELLAEHRSLRLVVLNSCEGARSSRTELFSSTGSTLAARGVPAVVSMQYEITDRAAIELSKTLYNYLAEGMPVDAALSEARKAIWMAREGTVEWGTPVLHMRSRDGLLFPVGLFGESQPPRVEAAKPAATTEVRQGLSILVRRVREYWIDGVLKRATYDAARQELLLETPGAGSRRLSPERSQDRDLGRVLRQALDKLGGSLLILGEPGSGKTTLLLELAGALLDAAEGDDRRPVPVVFNLSAWTGDGGFGEWLAEELAAKYLIPGKVGRAWLDERRILPLLDGLDEVDDGQRPACVEAVNGFAEDNRVGFAVCCRLREYLDLLPVRLEVHGALRLQPLSREKVLEYVDKPELAALKAVLETDSSLLVEARSPLMLSMMIQAYHGWSEADLPSEGWETATLRREHLIKAFVARRFQLARKGRFDARR